jgi:hypothetical protein
LEEDRRYVNVTGFPFPLTPLFSRVTTVKELVPGEVWAFEQEQGIGLNLGVSTNVRMTVVKLRNGDLWIHDPIAPTRECVEAVEAIRARTGGDVKYVVLATTQARSVVITLVPIRPRRRDERRSFLRTFSPGGRFSPPTPPRFRSRRASTPFNSD